MGFRDFLGTGMLFEAFQHADEVSSYAIISSDDIFNLTRDLQEYQTFRADLEHYTNKTHTEIKESFIVFNNGMDNFQNEMQKLAEKHNQSSIRFYEYKGNCLISCNEDINKYPGFGKIGVKISLEENFFNEHGQVNKLTIKPKSIEEGLGIIFPTADQTFDLTGE